MAAREYGAEWVDADSAYLPAVLVDAAIRTAPLIRAGRGYAAGMDPATRGNDWTLVVAWAEQKAIGGQPVTDVVVAGGWRWQGSKLSPLSPRAVLAEVARVLRGYGLAHAYVDAWSFDALADHARAMGIDLQQHTGDRDLPYARLRTLLASGLIELPPDPLMRRDLLSVRQRATSGAMKIHLPRTSDGRHADYAPAVALAATYAELGCANGAWDSDAYMRILRAFAGMG